MKIKLNSSNPNHLEVMQSLIEELPEISVTSKERKWGTERPSFKYKKQLYEFQTIEELVAQVKKIMGLTDKDYHKRNKTIKEEAPLAEELLLEIPIEKYNLSDLNIKLRLGGHGEKSSSYEPHQQTLHFEVEESPSGEENLEDQVITEPEILVTSANNDIILDIPSAKYSLHDLKLNIKFTQYGEPTSTYEVKKEETGEEAADIPADLAKEVGPFTTEDPV